MMRPPVAQPPRVNPGSVLRLIYFRSQTAVSYRMPEIYSCGHGREVRFRQISTWHCVRMLFYLLQCPVNSSLLYSRFEFFKITFGLWSLLSYFRTHLATLKNGRRKRQKTEKSKTGTRAVRIAQVYILLISLFQTSSSLMLSTLPAIRVA